MFMDLLEYMRFNSSNDDVGNMRKYPRRSVDSCVGIIDGKAYPVENWSHGGILFNSGSHHFEIGQDADITIKFKLSGKVMDVSLKAHVIRKSGEKFALEFHPLTKIITRKFQQVVDDFVAREFADSQYA